MCLASVIEICTGERRGLQLICELADSGSSGVHLYIAYASKATYTYGELSQKCTLNLAYRSRHLETLGNLATLSPSAGPCTVPPHAQAGMREQTDTLTH
jgi:hypothetical protein